MRAIADIEDFSQVRINYTALDSLRSDRRSVLARQWYFECRCPECEFEYSGSNERERMKKDCPTATGLLEHQFDTHFEKEG